MAIDLNVNPLPNLLDKLVTIGKVPLVEGVAKLLTVKFGESVSVNPPHVGPPPVQAPPPQLAPLVEAVERIVGEQVAEKRADR